MDKILFFSAPWCGPCNQMKVMINKVSHTLPEIEIIDITENMEKATEFQVMNVPTFIKTVDGKETNRKVGTLTLDNLKNL